MVDEQEFTVRTYHNGAEICMRDILNLFDIHSDLMKIDWRDDLFVVFSHRSLER